MYSSEIKTKCVVENRMWKANIHNSPSWIIPFLSGEIVKIIFDRYALKIRSAKKI